MSVAVEEIEIRQLAVKDSLEELTSLLHRAYKKQADKGFVMLASHQDVEMTKDRLKGAESYVGVYKGKLIAVVCYKRQKNDSTDGLWYDQPFVATYGQFAVDPEFQNCGLGTKLMDLMESLAKRDGATEVSIDTAENNIDLINYYKKRGYREVGHAQWTQVNYRSLILSKAIKQKNPL